MGIVFLSFTHLPCISKRVYTVNNLLTLLTLPHLSTKKPESSSKKEKHRNITEILRRLSNTPLPNREKTRLKCTETPKVRKNAHKRGKNTATSSNCLLFRRISLNFSSLFGKKDQKEQKPNLFKTIHNRLVSNALPHRTRLRLLPTTLAILLSTFHSQTKTRTSPHPAACNLKTSPITLSYCSPARSGDTLPASTAPTMNRQWPH